MLRRVVAGWSRGRPFAWLVDLLERLDREEPGLLRVLTYHRVERGDADPPPPPGTAVAPDAFAEQMRHLARRYHVVSAPELLDAIRKRASLPRRSVLITFDDGYRDFRDHAWPVLEELRLPVVLFVPTAFPDDPGRFFWWDRLHHALMTATRTQPLETPVGPLALGTPGERRDAYVRLRAHVKRMPHAEAMAWVEEACRALAGSPLPRALLNWDELRELARRGVTIGSHTRTHPLLTRVPSDEVRAEVRGALHDLERELGTALPILAYPAGAFDQNVVRIVGEEGYALAFTTVRGINRLGSAQPLELRRINVGQRTSLALLRAQLAGRSVGLNRFYPLRPSGRSDDAG